MASEMIGHELAKAGECVMPVPGSQARVSRDT